jgi:hypothetical protein
MVKRMQSFKGKHWNKNNINSKECGIYVKQFFVEITDGLLDKNSSKKKLNYLSKG